MTRCGDIKAKRTQQVVELLSSPHLKDLQLAQGGERSREVGRGMHALRYGPGKSTWPTLRWHRLLGHDQVRQLVQIVTELGPGLLCCGCHAVFSM
jgi:hypothetical protein